MENNNIKFQYTIEYWKYITSVSNDKKNKKYYFGVLDLILIDTFLYCPKELMQELIETIERQKLNNDNNSFFKDYFGKLLNLKTETLAPLTINFQNIIKELRKDGNFPYLHYIAKQTLLELKNLEVGKRYTQELKQLITNNEALSEDKEKIKHLIHFIIFELKDKKITDKTINECVDKIITKGGSIDDLVSKLDNLFNREPIKVRFIFALRGLKGNKNIKTNNFEIYNPNEKTLIKDDKDEKEFFGLNTAQKYMQQERCNIAIELDVIDPEFAKHEAVTKTNNLLSLLTYRDFKINAPLYIETGTFYAINSKGELIGGELSISDNFLNYQNSKNINHMQFNEEEISYFEKLIYYENLNTIDIKLLKSLNSKKRALEATNYNEAILWHWINIENLFDIENSSAKVIFDNAPYIITYNFIYHFLDYEFHYLTFLNFPFSNYDISGETQKLIVSLEGKTLQEAIEIAKNILKTINKDSFLYEKIEKLVSIFTNKKEFLKFIQNIFKNIEQIMVVLYKLRNKIVHEAHCEQSLIVQLYKNYADNIGTILLCYFVEQRLKGEVDLAEIINSGKYKYEKIYHSVESNDVSDFFKLSL